MVTWLMENITEQQRIPSLVYGKLKEFQIKGLDVCLERMVSLHNNNLNRILTAKMELIALITWWRGNHALALF